MKHYLSTLLFMLGIAVVGPAPSWAQDEDGGGGGGGGGGGPRGGAGSGPEFLTDSRAQLKERHPAVYPYDLVLAGTVGNVELRFDVDAMGFPRNITLAKASSPEFVAPAIAAVETWRFKPAQRGDRPVAAEGLRGNLKFNLRSSDVAFDATARDLVAELKKPEPAIVSGKELDGPIKVLNKLVQIYPASALAAGLGQGEAEVECIIDAEGRPRLPRIVSASHESFGWAAATAVLRVQFAPPLKGGSPVNTRIRIPFVFRVPTAGAPAGTPRG